VQDARGRAVEAEQLAGQYENVAVAMVSREMSEPKPDVKAWGGAFDAALITKVKAVGDQAEADVKLRELAYKLEDLQRKRSQLSVAAQRREHFVEVLVGCPAGQKARVELTYLVGGASWEPAYEARADDSPNAGAVELSTFATLRQSTGEDWAQARLVLSTAVPAQNATPPEINPLRVYSEEREAEKKVLVRREEYTEHAEASPQDLPAQSGEGRVAAKSQGLSVQLVVPEAADVPGDGAPVRIFVAKHRMRATFAYRTIPKLMPYVFRVADLTNSAPFPLLPGALDAFRPTGFISRYLLERVPQGGVFHLTFGIDEGVRVTRTVVEELKRDAGLFGGKKRFKYGYRFEVANYGQKAAEVEVSEHVPVSELDDILVEVDAKTTRGYELKAADGIVTWKLPLKPAEKRAVDLAFHVDVPSSYDSGGL
jgi:uncharacterized protein (TIGR02231 family)